MPEQFRDFVQGHRKVFSDVGKICVRDKIIDFSEYYGVRSDI